MLAGWCTGRQVLTPHKNTHQLKGDCRQHANMLWSTWNKANTEGELGHPLLPDQYCSRPYLIQPLVMWDQIKQLRVTLRNSPSLKSN